MKHFRSFLVTGAAVVLLCSGYASAADLVTYTFESTKAPTTTATHITATNFADNASSDSYDTAGYSGKAIKSKGYKTLGNYFYFSITPDAGYSVNLSSLSFYDKADGTSSPDPTSWNVKYQIGSGSLISDGTGSNHTSWALNSATGVSAVQGATSQVTLRIGATGATNDGNKYWRLDNVALTGDTQARASMNTVVANGPSSNKVLVGTAGIQYVLRTTNDAYSDTASAQALDYTMNLSSASGLSFTPGDGHGNGIGRGQNHDNTIIVDTSTSGTKGGNITTSSDNAWRKNLPSNLSPVDVYQKAELTVTGGSSLSIANANTSDGGQRAAARLKSLTKTSGDSIVWVSGLTAGGQGSGASVIAQNSNISGTAMVSGNVLNGTYSADYQLGFEHDDQTITGTSSNDGGSLTRTISKTVTNNSGDQSVTLDGGRSLAGLSAKSNKTEGSVASFLDGDMKALGGLVTTSWRDAVPGEGEYGKNLVSDVLTLHGTDGEKFVLQMTYDKSLLPSQTILPYLGWMEDGHWVNAVTGNSSSAANFVGEKAYDPTKYFVLGDYGVDTTNGVAWAVIDHNSDFSVVPEPATIALLGLGSLLLFSKRR